MSNKAINKLAGNKNSSSIDNNFLVPIIKKPMKNLQTGAFSKQGTLISPVKKSVTKFSNQQKEDEKSSENFEDFMKLIVRISNLKFVENEEKINLAKETDNEYGSK